MVVGGQLHEGFTSHDGILQGCPLSPAVFALAVAPALARVAAALRELDQAALVFAYLDDVVIHVDAQHAEAASALLAAEFGPLGLTLHADKTAVWLSLVALPRLR